MDDAERDWDFLDVQGHAGAVTIVDAVLLDSDHDTVRGFLHASDHAQARGSVASAVVALLRPAALILGPVAGGVGENVLVAVSRGIARSDVGRLGVVLDEGRFAIISVVSRPSEHAPDLPAWSAWRSAQAVATVDLDASEDDMIWAMLADSDID